MSQLDVRKLSEINDFTGDILLIAYRETVASALLAAKISGESLAIAHALIEKAKDAGKTQVLSVKRMLDGNVSTMSIVLLGRTTSRHLPVHDVLGLRGAMGSELLSDKTTILVALGDDDVERLSSIVAELARKLPLYQRKTEGRDSERENAILPVAFIVEKALDSADLLRLNSVGETLQMVSELVDTPTLELTTRDFAKRILDEAARLGMTSEVISDDALRSGGFGGHYYVGRAASIGPRLVIVHYNGATSKKRVSLVGKGVVYDTGGLSLKPRDAMTTMKTDMAGAAAVFGAMRLIGMNKVDCNVDFLFCLAENAIGPEAVRPDDVIKLYSGLSVEVNNTDAEGRLVLADGVAYASRHLSPDAVVDIATLTGAQLIATGKLFAGLLCREESSERTFIDAGKNTGDCVFPLIYAPEILLDEFKTEIADMLNTNKDRFNASSSCAGHFIERHLDKAYTGSYAHIDMAGPARGGERATAFGVLLLEAYVRRVAVSK